MGETHVISFTVVADFFYMKQLELDKMLLSYSPWDIIAEITDMEENKILPSKCSCPRGQMIGRHMAALCIHAHHNVNVTDEVCV